MTNLQGDILAFSGIAFQAHYYILPLASLRQVKRSNLCKCSHIRRIGTYTYCHTARIGITAHLGSRHERQLVVFHIARQLRQDEIVVEPGRTFDIHLEGLGTVIRILA